MPLKGAGRGLDVSKVVPVGAVRKNGMDESCYAFWAMESRKAS